MIPPRLAPEPMTTPHGVQASQRMARIYGFLRDNGIHLTPFSTDQCVQSALPRLQALRDELAATSVPFAVAVYYSDALSDLDTIIGRVPSARVTNAPAERACKPRGSSILDRARRKS